MNQQEFMRQMENFWAEVVAVWQTGLFGVDIGRIIVAILIFTAFLFLRGIFSRYVLSHLHRWASRTDTNVDDKIVDALIPPIRFLPIILGIFLASTYSGLDEALGLWFERIMRSLIAFTIFWGLHRAIEPLSHALGGMRRILSDTMITWIFRVVRVLVIFIGGAVILELWGIRVGPMLAGLGLLGAAVALGAQDLFKNLIGGLTVIVEKRFHPGDWIMVEGVVEGTVIDIGFRSTQVRRFDRAPVHVPNAALSDAAVTNFSRMSHRRIFWHIGVEYRTTADQLRIITQGITKYLEENEEFARADEVPTFVRVDRFGASSIDIMVYCFTNTTVWGEWLTIKEKLAYRIKEIVTEEAGTAFAFPSQSLYVESWPGDTPEMFSPPDGTMEGPKGPASGKAA